MKRFTTSLYFPSTGSNIINPDSVLSPSLKNKTSDIQYQQLKVYSNDNIFYNKAELLYNTKDVKTNKSTHLSLTDSINISSKVKLNTEESITDYLLKYKFIFTHILFDGEYWSVDGNDITLVNQKENSNLFKLELNNNSINIFAVEDNLLFPVYADANIGIIKINRNPFPKSNMVFDFKVIFLNEFLRLKVGTSLGSKTLGVGDGVIRTTSSYSQRYNYTSNKFRKSVFSIEPPNLITAPNTYPSKSQTWVHYFNELQDKRHNRDVTINKEKSFKEVPLEYLVTSTFESSVDDATIQIETIPLKSMMTPEGNYANLPFDLNFNELSGDDPNRVKRREYTKIYSGQNQSIDYDNLLLGFQSNTTLFKLPSGKTTYFHYPLEATQLSLSSSGLIEAGALPGPTPATSDKIFKKNAAYENDKYWGKSLSPLGDNGVWLCSWLKGASGSSIQGLENCMWMDRWYNPSIISVNNALTATTISLTANEIVFYDVPSQMTFDPGVWYAYQRIGTDDLNFFVDSFNQNDLVLHYKDDWGERIQDKSTFGNDGIFDGFTPSSISNTGPSNNSLNQFSIKLSPGKSIEVPYTTSIQPSGSFTHSFWVYSDNWNQNPGSSVYTTNFRSGSNIKITPGFFTPVVSVIERTYAHILQYSLCLPISDARIAFDNLILDDVDPIVPIPPEVLPEDFDWRWMNLHPNTDPDKGKNPLTWIQSLERPDSQWKNAIDNT